MIALTEQPIDPSSLYAQVRRPDCGGIVVFAGTVRDLTNGVATEALEYSAYVPMAETTLQAIEAELRERWSVGEVAMVHRLGKLGIGEVAVVVAVSCPHRAEAFAACQYAIDRLKEIVPIWKKDHSPDGSANWVHPGTSG